MSLDWAIIASVGALLLAIASFFSRSLDKSLSIREHDEFRHAVDSRFDQLFAQIRHDMDRIEARLRDIEKTRPTTGELEATIGRTIKRESTNHDD